MITPTLDLERSLAAQGYDLITGFDEVGRGAAVKVGNGNPVHVRSSRIGRAADEGARSASP